VCDMLLSRNIVTGPLANSTMTLRMHVRGGSIDGALTYVAGRPSSLRVARHEGWPASDSQMAGRSAAS